jgi:hypothetical protein
LKKAEEDTERAEVEKSIEDIDIKLMYVKVSFPFWEKKILPVDSIVFCLINHNRAQCTAFPQNTQVHLAVSTRPRHGGAEKQGRQRSYFRVDA